MMKLRIHVVLLLLGWIGCMSLMYASDPIVRSFSVMERNHIRVKTPELFANGNSFEIRFSWDNPQISFAALLDAVGELPIPPYLNRETEESDKETYQTVYSKVEGSVAAPTAGLHFTEDVLAALKEKCIPCLELTLHVGAGTFQTVKSETIEGHDMQTEFICG